jgi:hypothetical protein
MQGPAAGDIERMTVIIARASLPKRFSVGKLFGRQSFLFCLPFIFYISTKQKPIQQCLVACTHPVNAGILLLMMMMMITLIIQRVMLWMHNGPLVVRRLNARRRHRTSARFFRELHSQ